MCSLVPRPFLTAFFAAVAAKKAVREGLGHGCEKSCEGRPGYEATVCVLDCNYAIHFPIYSIYLLDPQM